MATVIDLRPERDLLDPCFETYRLDSRALGVAETRLEARVSCAELGPGQYGLCHVQLQLIHNALIVDDFNPGLFFYFTDGSLHRLGGIVGSAPRDSESPETSTVYKLRGSTTTDSFQFVSEKHAIILEPKGTLILLFTGPRETTQKFEAISSFELGLSDGVVLNALEIPSEDDKVTVHLLICSITDMKDKNRGISRLDWVVLEGPQNGDSEWTLTCRHQVHGDAVPKFTKLLYDGSNPENLRLLICADCRYRAHDESESSKKRDEDPNTSTPLYSYIQDEGEITVNFALEAGTSKNDIRVAIYSDRIQVKIRDVAVVDGKLHDNVDPTCSVWCILDSKLEITLVKRTEARWPRLLINDDRGEEILDPAYVEEVHHRLRHLTTTEEEATRASNIIDSERGENCDEPPDEFHVEIFRLTERSLERVGFSDLTGREHIMNIWTASGPQMVLRHDVDGLVWDFSLGENGSIRAKHVNTLSAFGYVVASKRDKVLLAGCVEAGYSALVDAKNNVFIYEHQNKGKPKKTVLKEYLVPLRPGATRVIGGRMLADKLFLLTSDTLFAITLPK